MNYPSHSYENSPDSDPIPHSRTFVGAGSRDAQPVRVVDDLSPFAVRPEGVNVILLNGQPRVVFVEDRFKAEGYDTQNSIHWPLSALNLQ